MFRALSCLVAVLSLAWARPACAELSRGVQTSPSQPARDRPAAAAGGTAVVRGRVVDAATGRGLSRVQVRANTPNPNAGSAPLTPYPWVTTTDAEGRYEIKGMPAGTYGMVATKTNYIRAAWGEQRVDGPAKRLPLADGQILEKIDFRMTHAGVVTGRVVDEFGDAVSDVSVLAMRYQYIQGSRRLVPSGRAGTTNDIGAFRIYGLSPGQYYVSATLRTFTSETTTDRSGYAPTFYPGTGNVAEAQRLTIGAGQTSTGVNLTLLPIQTSKASGIATDADGKPLGGAMIVAMQRIGMSQMGGNASPIKPDGTFTINNLTPGEYTLRVNTQTGESATTDITVTGSDISGLQLAVTKPSTIRGRIAFTASATAADPPKPTAIDVGAWRDWAIGQQVRSAAKIKDDGTFEISLPAGHVQLRAVPAAAATGGPPGWRLNRVIVNDVDAGDTGIEVPPNGTIENVVVEMTNHVNDTSGRVTDAEGKVVRDCFVIVFAQDPVHWTVQTRYLSVARPGLDDLFHMRLLAGDYYAVAMNEVETNAWTDPDFLAQARERATKFSIADGETKTIDLPLMPAPVY